MRHNRHDWRTPIQPRTTYCRCCCAIRLDCELVLGRVVPRHDAEYESNGNVLLDQIYGAKLHVLPLGEKAAEFADKRIQLLKEEGKKPYLIPMGIVTSWRAGLRQMQ